MADNEHETKREKERETERTVTVVDCIMHLTEHC